LFTPTAAVFIEVVKGRLLREFELAADATAYLGLKRRNIHAGNFI
jgi:hypothetical protein